MLSIQNKIDFMRSYIESYISSKSLSWSANTIRSEKYRLLGLVDKINGDPLKLWKELETREMNPYSKKTVWIRVVQFWDWTIEENIFDGPNPYKKWMDSNRRLFKHVYKRNLPVVSFEEAKQRILKIKDEKIKSQAITVLENGIRIGEFNTYQDGQVRGKGNKSRKIFSQSIPEGLLSYWKFYRALAEVGFKPHDLRKIRASDLAKKGLTEADLCYIFGWESFQTAASYLAPKKDRTLEEIFKQK